MKRLVLAIAIVAAACSSLPASGDGIVALEVFPPDSLFVYVHGSVTLHARALDLHGDSVAADLFWRTSDTAFVTLDSVSGALTGKSPGIARVQARVGTLASDVISFTVRPDTTTAPGIRR